MRFPSCVCAALLLVFTLSAPAAEINADKRAEIDKLLKLTGLEKLMDQMKSQMISAMKSRSPNVRPELFDRVSERMKVREAIELIIPIYDKYYSLEDLRAVNAFYESPAGQKVLSTLPQVMQESMKVGQEWGQRAGQQLAAELAAEANPPKQ